VTRPSGGWSRSTSPTQGRRRCPSRPRYLRRAAAVSVGGAATTHGAQRLT
jgi:hypothetical protein